MMSNDKYASLLYHKVNVDTLQTRLSDISCDVLFVLGIVGNVLGLFIFSSSRRTWRISSVYACLATCSSITNLLCVIRYSSILHSTSRHILLELVGRKWWACKMYEFSFSFRVISSWITLFWMFERLMCVSQRLRSIFNSLNAFKLKFIIPIIMMIIILGCVNGPPVYMFQPQIYNNGTMNSTIETIYCKVNSNVSMKWKQYFQEIHFGINHSTTRCVFSELIPTGMIILFNSYIIYSLVRTCRRLHQNKYYKQRKEQSRITSWMNMVLILHSSLFLLSLSSHISGHFMAVEAHETWWVSFAILINCSLNFYIYCLSGEAFRNEIRRFIQRFKRRLCYKLQICQNRRRRGFSRRQSVTYEMNNLQVIVRFNDASINNVI